MQFLKKFFPCLILCLGGGWLTGLVTQEGVKDWYPQLIKPYGTPPSFVFPIVWTILYILMAISLALLWRSNKPKKSIPLIFFVIQLFFNFNWSWIFFYMQAPGLALLDLILLWLFIVLTIGSFWSYTRYGSYLLLPYLLWVTYAFYLNLSIWIYN